MGGFIEPNIHPVLVHFTYALSVSAAGARSNSGRCNNRRRISGLLYGSS